MRKSLTFMGFKNRITFTVLNGMLYIKTSTDDGSVEVIIPKSEVDQLLTSLGELVRLDRDNE